ncbi:MAG: RluA family pseudouridine synthase [Deltaproteobacteria bacterium]|nr:RluA family pseudouridine synthase [Deltaproteobacteria bacterium]
MTVSADYAGARLDRLLRRLLADQSLASIFKLLRTGGVRLNGAKARGNKILAQGDRLLFFGVRPSDAPAAPPPAAVHVTFSVLFEDAHLLVLDKPAGLAVHPGTGIVTPTLIDEVRSYLGLTAPREPLAFEPAPAHRLDRDTSGVLVVAKTRRVMVALAASWAQGGSVRKGYLALVRGEMEEPRGTLAAPLPLKAERRGAAAEVRSERAVSHYRVLGSVGWASLLAVEIETGRNHQIRRHLQGVGHEVAGDRRHGDVAFNRLLHDRYGLTRLFLHAERLTLAHPVTGAHLELRAPLPEGLYAVLRRAGLSATAAGST